MRAVIQRVLHSRVIIGGSLHSEIGPGLLVLLGIEDADTTGDVEWLASKIINMRIFNDESGVMNLSVKETEGAIMVVSQFTLFASTKKGNRPGYSRASKGEVAIPLYDKMLRELEIASGKPVAAGVFGADMKIELVNEGPVTIVVDSKQRE